MVATPEQLALPLLTPHLEYRIIGTDKVLLVSETFNTLLHGQIYVELLPLLDGCHTWQEISKTLKTPHTEAATDTALHSLAKRGYIVAGQFKMDRHQAAFWTALGAPPTTVEHALRSRTLAVHGDDKGFLTRRFTSLGIATDSNTTDLVVYICEEYLDAQIRTINQRHLRSGVPWILIRPKGLHPMFGPVFRPATGNACWHCLAHRLQNNNEVHSFLRNRGGEKTAFRASVVEPVALDSVYGFIALEVAKWLVFGQDARLHEHVITFDTTTMQSAKHLVMHRPQCASCADPALRSLDRQPQPIILKPNPKAMSTSGGLRTQSPIETLERYRSLISPVSGIVTWVRSTTSQTEPWLHVHWAGSNAALKIKELSSLRRSLRSKSAGKGTSAEQSEVGALCEAIERYCGLFHGEEVRCRKRLTDFLSEGDARAIHPNDVQLFSERQLDHADEVNALGHFYNVIPPRFDSEKETEWSPVWSLTENRHRFLPTAMLYGMNPEQRGGAGLWADSNGCAAGNTLEEAILQGFLELVERDAFAIWWYNRLHQPGVDLQSFDDAYLAQAAQNYRQYNRDVWVLDITTDLGIPAFVALSRRFDRDPEDIIYGAGAHLDPKIAILRAVCELNQCLTWVPRPGIHADRYVIDDPMCLNWWKTTKLSNHPHLAPAESTALRQHTDYILPTSEDLKDDIEWCRAQVEAKGMEVLVLDQTRPDVKMPVVRVIVPGLRHFWERLAPGRLYDVPVQMGFMDKALDEADLNPNPVIA